MAAVVAEYLPIISAFLSVVRSFLAQNWPHAASDVLDSAIAALGAGAEGIAAIQALTEQMQAMVSAGRDPTIDEWSELKARSDAAHALIQGTQAPPPAPAPTEPPPPA